MSATVYRIVGKCLAVIGTLVLAGPVQGQNLGLEGETGLYFTPLAYTVASPTNNIGKPVFGFHFLAAGDVIGNFSDINVTVGAFNRVEFGYTRDIHSTADNPELSPLWHSGFNIVHGKANLLRENTGKHDWIPAISVGFLVRSQVHNVGGVINNKDTTNGDVYVVATKTIVLTKLHGLPLVLDGGIRGTNAEVWGLAGNATRFQGRVFGVAGFGLPGPAKSLIILGVEVAQQPPHPEGQAAAVIPTTITYACRIVPPSEHKFNIDVGVAQVANHILPGVALHSRSQFGMGISYAF